MRDWALGLLRCPTCHTGLARERDAVACGHCGIRHAIRDDVTDFLGEPHPIVARERAAVGSLDASAAAAQDRLAVLLRRLDAGGLEERDRSDFPCLAHAEQARGQISQLLARYPLASGSVVLELGADHCWASSLLLDAGCRVLALDITEHLGLAPRGTDPALCRIQADMNRLPIADGAVDVVWATAAAHHSWDLEQTFREAARVTRPGGRLVFCCEPLPSWPRWLVGGGFGAEERELGINETWIPRARWLRLCAAAGFRPRLIFPTLRRAEIQQRLQSRHLPAGLAPLLGPLLPTLQVSIHLLGERR